MNRVVRHASGLLAAAACLVAAAACGTDPDDDEDRTPAPASPTEATGAPGQPTAEEEPEATEVTVTMVDFQLELSETSFAPGEYTFVAEQAGEEPHALTIEGPGVSDTTPEISPGGGSEELTVTLEPGTYQLWCPVGDHREDGMETTIEVS